MINDSHYHGSSPSSLSLSLSPKESTKKMMQQAELFPTWPNFNFGGSILDQEMDLCMVDDHDRDFSYVISSNTCVPNMILDEFYDLKEVQTGLDMEGLAAISRGDIEEICGWINGDDDDIEADSSSHDLTMEEDEWSPTRSSESNHNSSVFPQLETPHIVNHQLTLIHLLRAYGEAVENGHKELAEVIANSICDKSSPLGNTIERVAYNLFQSRESQGEYLREESCKNLAAAFKVLYQCIPNGRFAHFTANSAILDSIPDDARVIHIVDFDMGEGVQWPPLLEALNRKGKAVKLTSIRSGEGWKNSYCWEFEGTRRWLLSHAKQCGVSLEIEEKSIEDLGDGLGREWVVFNCMLGLPHMGRRRPTTSVDGFLNKAKALIAKCGGILVLGDGEAKEDLNSCNGYASYFDGLLRHYQAVFESLELNFPAYLGEARVAMESLFLAPLISTVVWSGEWEETQKNQMKRWLGGRKMSLGSLVEAKEMVVEGENSYSVRIEGVRENEMVLRWKETPLVRVSTWM